MMGSQDLKAELETSLGDRARVVSAPCMGRCQCAPTVEVGHRHVDNATAASVAAVLESGETAPEIADYQMLDAYEADGGYALLRDCYAHNNRDAAIETIAQSGLRGMGGAGFPGGQKWRIVGGQPAPRLMAVNADEGEPGTFKDRWVIETKPHQFLEGMLIAAWAVDADEIYIYLRDEYPGAYKILAQEIAKLEAGGPDIRPQHPSASRRRRLYLRRGVGDAGIDRRQARPAAAQAALPRRDRAVRPADPRSTTSKRCMRCRPILKQGPEWYSGQGRHGRSGLRGFSVSGRVREPGVKIAPAGITRAGADRRVLWRHGRRPQLQGLPARWRVRRHPAGEHGRHPARFRDPGRAWMLRRFRRGGHPLRPGQCPRRRPQPDAVLPVRKLRPMHPVPGRHRKGGRSDGTAGLGYRSARSELSQVMRDASICGLGQAAPNPLQSAIKHFPEDIKAG